MKVNNVQNTSANINFKMALKINPKLRPEVEKLGPKWVEYFEKLGKRVENVKHYDVCFEDSVYTPAVRSVENPQKNYYSALQREEDQLGRFVYLTCGDETYGFYNPNEPEIFRSIYGKEAPKKYASFRGIYDSGVQAAELSKLLEKQKLQRIADMKTKEAAKLLKEAQILSEKEKLNKSIDNLFDKYAGAIPEEPTKKKSFWSRLFSFCK